MAHFYYIINNPDLKSETSDNFEVGINGDYEKFDFGLNGFWSNFDNRIDSYTRIANDSQGYAGINSKIKIRQRFMELNLTQIIISMPNQVALVL